MRHLVTLLDELRALDVGFISFGEGIDTTTPAGRLIFGIIASVAEFERERLRERTLLGLDRARANGRILGRRPSQALRHRLSTVANLSVRKAAAKLGCSPVTIQKMRRELRSV
jgi:DNA invertase Pin-like site-specific DNA recombinase